LKDFSMNSLACKISGLRVPRAILSTFLLVTVLSGCFAPPGVKDLEVRVRQYMAERQERDWVAVYDKFVDPDSKLQLPRDDFLRRRSGAYDLLGFSVDSATIEPEKSPPTARVKVRMEAVIPLMAPNGGSRTIRRELVDPQQWVVHDGKWYVRLKR
jgi:hypothetical protein